MSATKKKTSTKKSKDKLESATQDFTIESGKASKTKHSLWLLAADEKLPKDLSDHAALLKTLGDKTDTANTFVLSKADQSNKKAAMLDVIVRLPKRSDESWRWALASAVSQVPKGDYHLAHYTGDEDRLPKLLLGWALAQYQYKLPATDKPAEKILFISEPKLVESLQTEYRAIALVRDLINQPPNILHPEALGQAVKALADAYKGRVIGVVGEQLLEKNYPAIHAVGRASTGKHQTPRLLELTWGNAKHPRVSLVGKGVCFDSGGLNIKPGSSSRYMKKDMGGAAHVLGVAQLIMEAKLPVRLQVLVPAVENSISGDAFRPGDVIDTRLGKTVEIDNTDAEGRLILADALTKAAEDKPEIIVDFATLTGAARVAMGTEVPAFFTRGNELRQSLQNQSEQSDDLLWSLPLHEPYRSDLSSTVADMKNSGGGYGGAITAALFLATFVPKEIDWVHIDVMAWNQSAKPGRPVGGEAMGMMAVFDYLNTRFSKS